MIKDIFRDLKHNFNTLKTFDIIFRIEQLQKLKISYNNNLNLIKESLEKDLGVRGYLFEVSNFIFNLEIDHNIKNLKKWSNKRILNNHILTFPSNNYILPEPMGVSCILGCWNYPYLVTLKPLISSIAAGNCSIIKPSEFSPESSKIIKKIIDKSLNNIFYKCIEGDIEISKELCSLPFDIIMFTGSSYTGKLIAQSAAKNLTKCILELGGKNPLWVDYDCNLESAAKKIASFKFLNSGQSCYAPDYIFIHESIEEKFINLLKNYIIKIYGNNNEIINNINYSRIINIDQTKRIIDLLKGNNIVFQNGNIDIEEKFIPPIIIKNPDFESKLMNEEIFGPILPYITYKDISRTFNFINQKPKSLTYYYFGSINNNNYQYIKKFTSSGSLVVNDIGIQYVVGPFGGVGDSGNYKLNGIDGFNNFSHLKPIIEKPTSSIFDLQLKYPPFNKKSKILFNFILNYGSPNFLTLLWILKILILLLISYLAIKLFN